MDLESSQRFGHWYFTLFIFWLGTTQRESFSPGRYSWVKSMKIKIKVFGACPLKAKCTMLLRMHINAVFQASFNTVFGLVEGGKKESHFLLFGCKEGRKERSEFCLSLKFDVLPYWVEMGGKESHKCYIILLKNYIILTLIGVLRDLIGGNLLRLRNHELVALYHVKKTKIVETREQKREREEIQRIT